MQRYFCKKIVNNKVTLYDDDYHHIKNVMRMNVNDKIEVVFEKKVYECIIKSEDYKTVEIDKELNIDLKDEIEITLVIPLLKEQKMDFVLQKATELGISKIIPYYAQRSIVKDISEKEDKKIIRWSRICKEASEQSKRNTIPIITTVKRIEDLNLDGVKLVCSTCEKNENLKMFLQSQNIYDKITIVVGPEGGLTSNEEQKFNSLGYKSVTLGNRIMRVETVPIFILSVLNYELME